MSERELATNRVTDDTELRAKKREAEELSRWLAYEYPVRIEHVRRCKFLGIPPDELEYTLQMEAYTKEQRLRKLIGKPPLDEPKTVNLFKGEVK